MPTTPKELYAIQPGARILVTGANGYIGSHVVNLLLSLGYLVRGTVRAEKPWLDELFESKYGPGKFESIVVPRLDDQDVLGKALNGVSGIIHVASDVSFSPDASKVIPNVIAATEGILKAAAEHAEKSVKRVVLTSSSSAALLPQPGVEGIVATQDTWNDPAIKAAWDENTPAEVKAFVVYAASKTEGERTAWKWVGENKPQFVFNSVLPNMNTGKILHPEISGSTMKFTAGILDGDKTAMAMLTPQWYVDVEDTARIHVIALLDPEVQSERLFAFSAPFNWTDVINVFHKLRPGNTKLPDPPENELRDLSEIVPAKRAEQLLESFFGKSNWTGFEESLKAGIDSLGY